MRITTTDGQKYILPDMCIYCQMTTGGEHQLNCPLYGQPTLWDFGQHYIGGEIRKLSYPDTIAINKLLIDRHPEWGIKEI